MLRIFIPRAVPRNNRNTTWTCGVNKIPVNDLDLKNISVEAKRNKTDE